MRIFFFTVIVMFALSVSAQEIENIAPVAMIFVPSIGGISHAPKEYSTPVDMANGGECVVEGHFNDRQINPD